MSVAVHELTHAFAAAAALAHAGVNGDNIQANIAADGPQGWGHFGIHPSPDLPDHIRHEASSLMALGPLAVAPNAAARLMESVTRGVPPDRLFAEAGLSHEDLDLIAGCTAPPLAGPVIVRATRIILDLLGPGKLAELTRLITKASQGDIHELPLRALCPSRIASFAVEQAKSEIAKGKVPA